MTDAVVAFQESVDHDRYGALFEQSMDGVLFTSPDGTVLEANPAACEILRMEESEICALGRGGLADPSDERWAVGVAERARTGRFRGDLRMIRGDGSTVTVEVTSQIFAGYDGALHTCVVFRDITERLLLAEKLREANERLEQLAITDDLTGLRNRRGFTLLAHHELEAAARRGEQAWLAFVDVNEMKSINDDLGHHAGDEALRLVAGLLLEHIRASDVAARIGGDEFCLLITVASKRDARAFVRRLRAAAKGRTLRDGRRLSLSVGLSAGPAATPADIARALTEADHAMYRSKHGVVRPPSTGAAG